MPLSAVDSTLVLAKLKVMAALVVGRRDAAIRVLDGYLAREPDDGWALASRSHLHAQGGRDAAAVVDAERLVERHPERSAADWFNLAFLRERLGRFDSADEAFRRSLALDPKLDRAWYGLALVLVRQGRLDEAVKALKKNTELQPMSPYGWYQLARVHVDRSEPEKARRVIAHLKTFEPKVAAQLERETGLVA